MRSHLATTHHAKAIRDRIERQRPHDIQIQFVRASTSVLTSDPIAHIAVSYPSRNNGRRDSQIVAKHITDALIHLHEQWNENDAVTRLSSAPYMSVLSQQQR